MLPVIFGIETTHLSEAETDFLRFADPWGVILFKRNIADKKQLQGLTASLQAINPDREYKILIDQEGGRVQRLQPPIADKRPPAGYFSDLYATSKTAAKTACYESNLAMAQELAKMGVNVNCTPVLDLPIKNASDIIGDRAYGDHADKIIDLGAEVIRAHIDAGIAPIIKHIPGHGRALVDSHHELPIVRAKPGELEAHDFRCFREISYFWQELMNEKGNPLMLPLMAMTAHIVYSAYDEKHPATLSPLVIDQIIRKKINFNGLLLSDDICMKALNGTPEILAIETLKAGCDLVLHCNGELSEMKKIANTLRHYAPPLRMKKLSRKPF